MDCPGDIVLVDAEGNPVDIPGMPVSPSDLVWINYLYKDGQAPTSQPEPSPRHSDYVTQLEGQPSEPEPERAVDDQDGVRGGKRKAVTLGEPADTSKRQRNYSDQETKKLLDAKLGLLTSARSKGHPRNPKWAHQTSSLLFSEYNFDRSYKSHQQKWDSLLKEYKAIKKHNLTNPTAYYWDLGEEDRIRYKLPKKELPWEIYHLMEILVVLEGAPLENQETKIEGNCAFQTEASVSEHLGDPSSSGRISQPVLDSEGTNDTAPAVMEDQPLSPSLTKLVEEVVDRRFAELVKTLPFGAFDNLLSFDAGNAERDHVMNSPRSSASSHRWSALLKKVSQILKVIRALRVGHHGDFTEDFLAIMSSTGIWLSS